MRFCFVILVFVFKVVHLSSRSLLCKFRGKVFKQLETVFLVTESVLFRLYFACLTTRTIIILFCRITQSFPSRNSFKIIKNLDFFCSLREIKSELNVKNIGLTFIRFFVNSLQLHYSDWVCTAVMSNDVMKDLRG